jgi:predicted DNA-binding transcriptional regulator AlpA
MDDVLEQLRALIDAANFPPILTTEQASQMTGMSVDWFGQGRLKGFGPPYLRLGRAIRYDRDKVLEWFRTHEVRP